MTNEEKEKILRQTETFAYGVLSGVVHGDAVTSISTVHDLIQLINETEYLITRLKYEAEEAAHAEQEQTTTEPEFDTAADPRPIAVPEKYTLDVNTGKVEPESTASTPTESVKQYPDLADVRARLADYASRGVKVAELLSGIGYARLSSVPAEEYAGLLEKAEAAAKKGE